MKKAWEQPRENLGQAYKDMLISYRAGNSIERVEKPMRIDRARALGYRAKQGFTVARVRVIRGGKKNTRIGSGRDGGDKSTKITQSKNYQQICEERAQKRFVNFYWLQRYARGRIKEICWDTIGSTRL